MVSNLHDSGRERQWVCACRLSERRRDLGLTQFDVVERLAAIGVTARTQTLSAMEHGQGLEVGRLPELAIALDCTITYLLGLTEDPKRWTPDNLSVPVTVDITTPLPDPGRRTSWILGPDIPDRENPSVTQRRRA